jgi:hypothetical protein
MTLYGRNIFFKVGIVLTSLCLLLIIGASIVALPVYADMQADGVRRTGGLFQDFVSRFLSANLYAVHASMALSALFAFIAITLIYYFFEKTASAEILFVAFFAASFSLETVRLILPLGRLYEVPSLYVLAASRVLLFGRYYGIFSLFAASVYAAGLAVQKQRNMILSVTLATLVVALGVPVDTQIWDASFTMISGSLSLFRLIETGTFLITVVSFFIAANTRGCRDYAFIGTGAALAFLGRNLLIFADTWAGPASGIIILVAGTWLICIRLHKIYLWL